MQLNTAPGLHLPAQNPLYGVNPRESGTTAAGSTESVMRVLPQDRLLQGRLLYFSYFSRGIQ